MTWRWARVNIDNMDGPIDLSACDPSNNVGKAAVNESPSVWSPPLIWNLCLTASSYPRDFSDSASLNLKSWMKCVEKVFRYYNHISPKPHVASNENVHSFWQHLMKKYGLLNQRKVSAIVYTFVWGHLRLWKDVIANSWFQEIENLSCIIRGIWGHHK